MFSRQVNITSHHQTFLSVPGAKLDSRIYLETLLNTPSRDFPSKIGKEGEATQRLLGDVLICLLAYETPAHIDGHTEGSCKHLVKPTWSLDDPAVPTCVLSRKVDGEVIASFQVPSETNGVRTSDFRQSLMPTAGG